MTAAIDHDFVRAQFPAFSEPELAEKVFVENAGGSYACRQVIDRLTTYYRRFKIQPGYRTPASLEAYEWMDASHVRLAEYLGVGADHIHLGPSTSQNTYVLAQAVQDLLQPGDEIIVTNQDHEANNGVWRRLSRQNVVVREWGVDPSSGLLDPEALDELLNDRTRLVAFPQASNILAHHNPVADITVRIRAAGAISVVDGVSAAPHGFPDVAGLGADIYLFSLYKTFGPHQGLMVLAPELLQRLRKEGHYFNADQPRKRLVPAGPDHAQVAAARGIAEYFDALDHHHGGGPVETRPQRVRELLHGAEMPLQSSLLAYLCARDDVRVLGPHDPAIRMASVAFVPKHVEPADVVPRLAVHGVMAAAGHFYSLRLLEAMGVNPARGVVRLSCAHYNTAADIDRVQRALDQVLSAHA